MVMKWVVVVVLVVVEGSRPRLFLPPQPRHLWNHSSCVQRQIGRDPWFNCHGARFERSLGHFRPCSRHSHCYDSREPSDWCLLPLHHLWTNWGCHCDRKIGSCVIERLDAWRRDLQWSYCTPKAEFTCANQERG